MAQAPEHSGNSPHDAFDAALDDHLAPHGAKTRAYYQTVSFSAAGIELGLSVVIGALLGHWFDGLAGTDPLLMLLMTILGFTAGVRAMVRAGRRATRGRTAAPLPEASK
jgi:F0F1-type ATP synthase assembly protein I